VRNVLHPITLCYWHADVREIPASMTGCVKADDRSPGSGIVVRETNAVDLDEPRIG
jgi:hypothetical protein